eukprot:NODE_74_length_24438_cov_0.900283.p14 type:complete len:115 gc:universal NODE_74_length_24438_cov_0.900283:20295-19951(-)
MPKLSKSRQYCLKNTRNSSLRWFISRCLLISFKPSKHNLIPFSSSFSYKYILPRMIKETDFKKLSPCAIPSLQSPSSFAIELTLSRAKSTMHAINLPRIAAYLKSEDSACEIVC